MCYFWALVSRHCSLDLGALLEPGPGLWEAQGTRWRGPREGQASPPMDSSSPQEQPAPATGARQSWTSRSTSWRAEDPASQHKESWKVINCYHFSATNFYGGFWPSNNDVKISVTLYNINVMTGWLTSTHTHVLWQYGQKSYLYFDLIVYKHENILILVCLSISYYFKSWMYSKDHKISPQQT